MWITQSYLGNPEPEANLFVYYLFEEYVKEQVGFTNNVWKHMGELGKMYQNKVSLFAPNEQFTAQIGGEIRGIYDLWRILENKLPGIFVSTKPLSEFDRSSEHYHFFTLKNLSEDKAVKIIKEIRRLADDQIDYCRQNDTRKVKKSFWKKLYNSIELKFGCMGIAIDLKKLWR